ncbi:hypothetical protein [Vitreimonas sp.]|uniref:hypothetical protein n=1 Tax=Vitreimonas sp. TaxID=3069702 RepID=UPI002EDB42DA
MKHVPTLISRQELDRHQAALVGWIVWALMLIFKLGANARRSKRVHNAIRHCERFVHAYLICTILARLRVGARRPRNTAPGIRANTPNLRLLAQSLRLRAGTFLQRILHVLELFSKPEKALARLARKLRGQRFNLVIAAPIADAIVSAAPCAIIPADSS